MSARRRKYKMPKSTLGKVVAVIAIVAVLALAVADYTGAYTYERLMQTLGLTDKPASDADVSVHFIDVGQGDATLIISDGISVLIDAGERENAEKVTAYIRAQGITKLDYIIATHPHSDHMGALGDVILSLGVTEVIAPIIPEEIVPTTATYERFMNAVEQSDCKVTPADHDFDIQLGNAVLTIYGVMETYDELNNCSVVARLSHGENSFLFTGDAEKEREDELIERGVTLSAKVLKVGHHGSSTSSKKDFLNEVLPRYAVIMCAQDNSYNHPNEKTVERLEKYCDKIYRTDLNGTVVVESDGEGINIICEKE